MLEFHQDTHQYKSIIPDNLEWLSVTKIIGALCPPFDAYKMSQLCSKKRKSKWYGMDPADIRAAWDGENKRSTELGHWYHNLKEQEAMQKSNVVAPIFKDNVKIAPFQQLKEGMCYPEHLVYLTSVGIAGQVDYPEVTEEGVLNITDYKTSKEIRREGWKNYEGISAKMLAPVHHLDECEFNHYALQLSLYAYIITRHNPSITVGNLTIEHVKFEEEGRDKYDYPIYTKVEDTYIVKEVEKIQLPYLKKEVVSIIEWLKINRNNIK